MLQSILGDEYNVHTTRDIYRSSHIDSTVMCLKPGLVLLNDTRVNEKHAQVYLRNGINYISLMLRQPQK